MLRKHWNGGGKRSKKAFARCESGSVASRRKRVRYLISALGVVNNPCFFDAFTAGNGSAFVLIFTLAFYKS